MTTEIQIKRSRSYLPHLRRIVSCVAARLGMSRKDIQETEDAVSEACLTSIEMAPGCQDPSLSIRLTTCGTYLTVEISDPYVDSDSKYQERLACLKSDIDDERAGRSLDGIELVRGEIGATIRITRHARVYDSAPAAAYQLSSLGRSALNA